MIRGLSFLAGIVLLGCAAAPASAQAKVTVTMWASGMSPRTLGRMVDALELAHPDITVQAAYFRPGQYAAALRAGASSRLLPDIVAVRPGAPTQRLRGALIPLGAIADQELGKQWQKGFPVWALDDARLGNRVGDNQFYMLPMTTGLDGLWISGSAAGSIGKPPGSVAALVQAAGQLGRNAETPLVIDGASDHMLVGLFMQILAASDAPLVRPAAEDKAVWTNHGMVHAAAIWRQLFARQVIPQGAIHFSGPQARQAFLKGKAAMIAGGPDMLAVAAQSSGSRFAPFPPPNPSSPPAPPTGGIGLGWAITRTAAGQGPVKVASAEVLRDLIAGPAAEVAVDDGLGLGAWHSIVPHVSLPADVRPVLAEMRAKLPEAVPDTLGNPYTQQALAAQLRLLAQGKTSPSAAMAAVNRKAQREQELAG
jgi:ABC-type glycerol-3-phosphate transport system substrate-binding protein